MVLSNLAKGKITWTNSGNTSKTTPWRYLLLTDGVNVSTQYLDGGASNNGQPLKITLDLGHVCSISEIKVWHYFADSRIYYNSMVEASVDGISWTTIFDSSVSGTYTETSAGKTHTFAPLEARYIRDGIKGSNKNTSNHWVELEVWGDHPEPDSVVSLPSIADANTNGGSVSAANGTGTFITAGSYTGNQQQYDLDLWLKFDLAALAGIPSGAIRQAILRMNYYYGDIPNRIIQLEIYPVTSTWEEETITYATRPSWGQRIDVLQSPSVSNNGYGWREADVTSLVKSWVDNPSLAFGIRADHTGIEQPNSPSAGDWNHQKYYTREYNGGSHAPYIEVQYALGQLEEVQTVMVQFF